MVCPYFPFTNKLCRVSKEDTRQKMCLSSVSIERSTKTNLCLTQALSIGNERQLPSAIDDTLRVTFFVKSWVFGKCVFAEYLFMPSVRLSVRRSSPSVTLDKMFFADCDKLPSTKR
jgi:hypothetical protein